MKKLRIMVPLMALTLLFNSPAYCQNNTLDSLEGFNLKIYHSKGHEHRAGEMARLSHDAISYMAKHLSFTPEVHLLILSPSDWPRFTDMPVYGMPHYADSKTLIVAAENNALWNSFIPPMDQLPADLAGQVKLVYNVDGEITMQPFFDMLALHELGHAFHKQASLNMQRNWMGELFCNLLLHTFIAENKPEMLPALTVFPNMVVAGGSKEFSFTTLDQFERHYTEIATKHSKNYGWYQCRLHAAAREIYDAGGKDVLKKLWIALQEMDLKDDLQFAEYLNKEVHSAVAEVMKEW